jgi:hypothetical protein
MSCAKILGRKKKEKRKKKKEKIKNKNKKLFLKRARMCSEIGSSVQLHAIVG